MKKPMMLRVVDLPATDVLVTICRSLECEYRFDGVNLFIKPLSAGRRREMAAMYRQTRLVGQEPAEVPVADAEAENRKLTALTYFNNITGR